MGQMLAILNKMDNTRTKNDGALWLQENLDYLLYYICPDQWIMDFDCLFSGLSPEQAYYHRLAATILLPLLLISIDLITIFVLTYCSKLLRRA